MPSDTSIQQSLLDTIDRPFYQQLPSDSQEPESQKVDLHPPEKDQGIGAASGHPYQLHPITPERLEITKKAQPPQPREQRQHHHHHGLPTSGLVFLLRWGCAILTAAATILFGVWAPLSYQATKEANKDNDEIQRALMRSAKSANEIASSALYAASQQLDIATAQASVISNLQDQLAAMGQVVLLQFCNAQTRGDLGPCSAFITSAQLSSLISQIATPIPTARMPTSTNTALHPPTHSPSDSDNDDSDSDNGHSPSRSVISITSILGIVFGGTAAMGILTGYLVWRYQRGRLVDSRRYQ
ncbi:hypothetical protein EMCG_01000 [[Emmonsia] crescens]|uniref:Uncharacterized protein n=1 Tax=[Emmonsia] crescens TaxID=73230 RepID=A0A0G2IDL9_9EURO|nr:hypothetical protein EMCG_01000 [Emmonsia crescens UAMH 3008]